MTASLSWTLGMCFQALLPRVLMSPKKPYKLKPSGESLTRDDLSTWREVILSHMRQNDKWKDFLPGGPKSEWKAEDDAENDDCTVV